MNNTVTSSFTYVNNAVMDYERVVSLVHVSTPIVVDVSLCLGTFCHTILQVS